MSKPDLQGLAAVMRDGRVWCARGVVQRPPGDSSHYEVDGADVVLDVVLEDGTPVQALLGSPLAGGAGWGIWGIPSEGTDVLVALPQGQVDACPIVVACLGGKIPAGLAPDTLIIVAPADGQVLVHDGNAGEAKALATKEDLDAHIETFNGHKHAVASAPGMTTEPASDVTIDPGPPIEITPTFAPAGSSSGTQTLRAK